MEAGEGIPHGPDGDVFLAPAEPALGLQPDILALHFQHAEVCAILLFVVEPDPGFLRRHRRAEVAHPEHQHHGAQHRQHGGCGRKDALFPQSRADAFQRGIRLGFRLHRHRQLHLLQLGAAGFAFLQMLFHQCRAGRTCHVLGVQRQQIPDDFTIQFHRLFLLFGLFHHNNAQKEKTLQGF